MGTNSSTSVADVLTLDEATSALDPTSRVLVFEGIKRWRNNKTTIVITHDLSQITSKDFVYVLGSGTVVEQGYRADLEQAGGEFRQMMDSQGSTGLAVKHIEADGHSSPIDDVSALDDNTEETVATMRHTLMPTLHGSAALGNWMFDAVADLTKAAAPRAAITVNRESQRVSRFIPLENFTSSTVSPIVRRRRPSSISIIPASPTTTLTTHTRRYSLQMTPTSPTFSLEGTTSLTYSIMGPTTRSAKRRSSQRVKRPQATVDEMKRFSDSSLEAKIRKTGDYPPPPSRPESRSSSSAEHNKSLTGLLRDVYPHLPNKPLIFFGLFLCLLSGAITPIFSFVLSRLFLEVSHGAQNTSAIDKFGGIILSIAALDGILMGSKYCIMETSAMMWITKIRRATFDKVLAQDKKWFDQSENSAPRMVQILMKDGDDARNLIAVVIGQFVVVTAMFALGFIWAMVRGWQLTLAGLAIGPIFAGAMALQAKWVADCDLRNKRAREDVAKGYYEVRHSSSVNQHMDSTLHRQSQTFEESVRCLLNLSSGRTSNLPPSELLLPVSKAPSSRVALWDCLADLSIWPRHYCSMSGLFSWRTEHTTISSCWRY